MPDMSLLDLRTTDCHGFCVPKGNNLKHEVWDERSPNYLNFQAFDQDSSRENNPSGLIIVTKVTHGLRITLNDGLYMPWSLTDGLYTLNTPYNKPVKPQHKLQNGSNEVPPIGRILDGDFIRTPEFAKGFDPSKMYDVEPRSFESSRMIRDSMRRGNLLDPDFEGLGFTLTKSLVTDEESIRKILRGEMLTVSVEMTTDAWINPITGNDWIFDLDEGEIDYFIGDTVDGMFAAKVANRTRYDGFAFVTHPADQEAVNIGVKTLQGDEFQQVRKQFSVPMVVMDSQADSALDYRDVFDSVGKTPRNQFTNVSQTSGANPMDELIKEFADACLGKKEFSKASELYGKLKDEDHLTYDEVQGHTPKSVVVNGVPLISTSMIDAVMPHLKDSELEAKLSVIKELIEDGSSFLSHTRVKCGKRVDDSSQEQDETPAPQKEEGPKSMNKEGILALFAEDSALQASVLADLKVGSVEELQTQLADAQSQLADSEAKLLKSESRNEVYKEHVQDGIDQVIEVRQALETSVKDHKVTLVQLATVVTQLSVEDAQEVSLDGLSLKEAVLKVNEITDSFDVADARAKVQSLLPKAPEGKVEDPTVKSKEDLEKNKSVQDDEDVQVDVSTLDLLARNTLAQCKKYIADSDEPAARRLINKNRRALPENFASLLDLTA